MIRSRGFSLLEVMLALIVVAIGISVVMTFSASNQRETSSKSTGNDYSLVVNEILEQFVSTVKTCDDNAPNGACDLVATSSPMSAYEYLGGADNISDTQKEELKKAGIDLETLTVTLTTEHSDV